jgi:hypothetical protein
VVGWGKVLSRERKQKRSEWPHNTREPESSYCEENFETLKQKRVLIDYPSVWILIYHFGVSLPQYVRQGQKLFA